VRFGLVARAKALEAALGQYLEIKEFEKTYTKRRVAPVAPRKPSGPAKHKHH
jgi:hypothetical protein